MIGPVQAIDLIPGDVIVENDWRLLIKQAYQGEWTDSGGHPHTGEIVVTQQLGPMYTMHFALAETVLVDRQL